MRPEGRICVSQGPVPPPVVDISSSRGRETGSGSLRFTHLAKASLRAGQGQQKEAGDRCSSWGAPECQTQGPRRVPSPVLSPAALPLVFAAPLGVAGGPCLWTGRARMSPGGC